MLVTGSITRIQSRPFGALFLQNVAERALIRAIATTFDRYAGIDGSEDAAVDAAGPTDVCAIAVTDRHPLPQYPEVCAGQDALQPVQHARVAADQDPGRVLLDASDDCRRGCLGRGLGEFLVEELDHCGAPGIVGDSDAGAHVAH